MYLNKVYILGNLSGNPELKALPGGSNVASFGMATNRVYKDTKTGETKKMTEWHNIVVFGRSAELCAQYLKKGQSALIEGRIQTRSWDGQDGKKNYRTEIIADNVQFGPKPDGTANGGFGQSAGSDQSGSFTSDPFPAPTSGGDAFSQVVAYPDEQFNPNDIPF